MIMADEATLVGQPPVFGYSLCPQFPGRAVKLV
jgi:hypothetical protein